MDLLYLDCVYVVWLLGEIGAAGMARRDILHAVRAAHWVEGSGGTRAVGVAIGRGPAQQQQQQQKNMDAGFSKTEDEGRRSLTFRKC